MNEQSVYAMALARMETVDRSVDVIRLLDPDCIPTLALLHLAERDVDVRSLSPTAKAYVMRKSEGDVEAFLDVTDAESIRKAQRPGRPPNSNTHLAILAAALALSRTGTSSRIEALKRAVALLGDPITTSMLEKAEASFVAAVNCLPARTCEERLDRVGALLKSTMHMLRDCEAERRQLQDNRRKYPRFYALSAGEKE